MEFTTHLELQSQTTRLVESRLFLLTIDMNGAFTLLGAVFISTLSMVYRAVMPSTDYNSEDFQSELFPLHSPLLGKSLLVSFPPLSYMLKFGGYSCLIGGPNWKASF